MNKKNYHSLWIALFLTFCLSLAHANESEEDNSDSNDGMQMTDTQLDGGGVINSLMNTPDTSIDTSKVNAARQQNQMNRQQRAAEVEAAVRRDQNNPELQRRRARGSNSSATGGITVNGQGRDLENLTDAERVMADEFVHKERSERIYREECGGKNRSTCEGKKDPNAKGVLGIDPGTMEMMAKAYTMIIGFTGDGFTRASKEGGTADSGGDASEAAQADAGSGGDASSATEGAEAESESVSDYCKYIPMGVEGLAMFQQMSGQDQIKEMPSSSGSRQRDTLLQAAKSHDERSKQAKIQATGWTATTTCYIGYGLSGTISATDPGYLLKLAGSGLFSWYYWDSVGRHEDDADQVRAIADKLPSKGDCNPITDRLCYCNEEATRNDPDFCMPEIRQRFVDKTAEFNTACINNKGKTDAKCKCRESNTCLDRKIEDSLRGVGFSTSDLKGLRPVQELSRGSLSTSGLNQAQRTNSALANRIRKNFGKDISKLANSKRLTPKQQADADKLAEDGFPKPMAEILSAAPLDSKAQEKLSEMKNGSFGNNNNKQNTRSASYRPSGSSIQTSGGRGLNPGSRASDNDSGNEFADMMNKLNGEDGRETASGGQVIRFAERAQDAAQISKKEETFLFDIISHRYQKTAWKRFDVDFDALPEVSE